MSLEVYGDGGDDDAGGVTDERVEEMVIMSARVMREMLARFVEQGGDKTTAESIRANWLMGFGADPGRLDGELPHFIWNL